jgi:putative nucleotidyltransferase with HDIG domain
MTIIKRLRPVIYGAATVAAGLLLFAVLAYDPSPIRPSSLVPSWSQEPYLWIQTFAVLFALALASELMALRITERGTATTMDYVPHLAAIVLLGPSGAALLTVLSMTLYQLVLSDKPLFKALFNISQVTGATSLAAIVYAEISSTTVASGPIPAELAATCQASTNDLTSEAFQNFPFVVNKLEILNNCVWGQPEAASLVGSLALPFIAGVVVYFAINSLSVTFIISRSEQTPFLAVWRQVSVAPVFFDLVMSSLAFLVAWISIAAGPAYALAGIIPVIGLRYSYGVNLELKQLNTDLLRVLIKTIEAQDPYTSGHSVRVAEGAVAIADSMGLDPKEVRKIETAALLHDIGKIDAVYRNILRQDGPLSDDQWELIRKHPERGVNLVKSVRSMNPDVLKYIRHHHERWDGEGYPDGISKDDIPLGARIIMVSDTIDAMITERPYRDALPPEVIREELLKHQGEQFDPDVVQAAIEAGLLDRSESPNTAVKESHATAQ